MCLNVTNRVNPLQTTGVTNRPGGPPRTDTNPEVNTGNRAAFTPTTPGGLATDPGQHRADLQSGQPLQSLIG